MFLRTASMRLSNAPSMFGMINKYNFKPHNHGAFSTFKSEPPAIGHDTPLHAVIRNCSQLNEFHAFLKKHPANNVAAMATTTNDHGEIPLDVLYKNKTKLNDKAQEEIKATLFQLIKSQKSKPLTEQICIDDVLKNYYPHLDAEFCENVELACAAVNDIRRKIKFSYTHPDLNHLDKKKQDELYRLINRMRISTKVPVKMTDLTYPRHISSAYQSIEGGNCDELSFAVVDFLMNHSKQPLVAEVVEIDNGDHTFVVFGPPRLSGSTYTINYEQAVYCDAWSGVVGKYNNADLAKNMADFKHYEYSDETALNVLTTFNPNFHRIKTLVSYYISGTDCQKNLTRFSLFNGDNKTIGSTNTTNCTQDCNFSAKTSPQALRYS